MTALVFLGFFRARWAVRPFWEGSDDACYRALALFWTGLEHGGCESSSYFPGVALIWAPASLLTTVTQNWGVEHAMGFWVGLQSFAMGIGSIVLLTKILQRRYPSLHWGWVWCLAANVPLLYYFTARTSLPHAGEWLLALLVWDSLDRRRFVPATLFALWLTATRFNDAPVLFLVAGALAESGKHRRPLGWVLFASALVCAGVAWDLGWNGYNSHPLVRQLWEVGFSNAGAFLWGMDWGVLWSSPLWVATLVAGVVYWKKLSGVARGAWGWMFCEAALCATWPTNGSDFGYRYLIGSYVGALCIGAEIWPRLPAKKAWQTVAVAGALWMTLQTWAYRTHPLLTPAPIFRGYRVADYQWRAVIGNTAPLVHQRALALSPTGTVVHLLSRHTTHPRGVRTPHLFGVRAWIFLGLSLTAWGVLLQALFRWIPKQVQRRAPTREATVC